MVLTGCPGWVDHYNIAKGAIYITAPPDPWHFAQPYLAPGNSNDAKLSMWKLETRSCSKVSGRRHNLLDRARIFW
jgi:hypothetical protein